MFTKILNSIECNIIFCVNEKRSYSYIIYNSDIDYYTGDLYYSNSLRTDF